jgi:plastocyanin
VSKSRRIAALVVAGLLLATVAACDGGGGPTPAPVTELSVEGTEFQFTPDTLSAPAGDIKVTLVNAGGVEHDFVIDDVVHIHTEVGETNDDTFSLGAGTYDFYCSIPGHRQAGMEGTLTVSE